MRENSLYVTSQNGVLLSPGNGFDPSSMVNDVKQNNLKNILYNLWRAADGNDYGAIKYWVVQLEKIASSLMIKDQTIHNLIVGITRRASEKFDNSINLDTGEKEKDLKTLVEELSSMLGIDLNQSSEALDRIAVKLKLMQKQAQNIAEEEVEEEEEEETEEDEIQKLKEIMKMYKEYREKRRRSGSTPFKVLMGLVQKLLMHGMTKNEIIRLITKRPNNKWPRNTVERCVDIVQDYLKKPARRKKKAENVFNMAKYSQVKGVKIPGEQVVPSVYDVSRDVKFMTGTELQMRRRYLLDVLTSADQYEKVDDTFDTRKAKKDLKVIEEELKNRGIIK